MQDSTDDRKVKAAHASAKAYDIVYLGVLVFGKKKDVEELTRSFSLLE